MLGKGGVCGGGGQGREVMTYLMDAAEEHREKITIILAGYQQDIDEKVMAFNDGMPGRFKEVIFHDDGCAREIMGDPMAR